MYKLLLAPGVAAQIAKLSPFTKRQIETVFAELTKDPYTAFDAMRMRGGSFVRYRCKVGDHRIIYLVNDDRIEIYVLKVGNRKDVYE